MVALLKNTSGGSEEVTLKKKPTLTGTQLVDEYVFE